MRRLALTLGIIAAAVAAISAFGRGGDEPARPAAAPRPTPTPRPLEPLPDRITEAGLAEHLRALQGAADAHGGTRAAGTPGDRATGAYIERRLRAAGYRVSVRRFRVPYFDERSPPRLTAGDRRFRPERDHRTLQFSGSGRAMGAVREFGLGCDAFAAPGAIALLQRGTCTFRAKARNAERAGAAAVLIADSEPVRGSLQRPVDIPVLAVSDAAAGALVGATATVAVDAVSETRTTANVVAETGAPDAARVIMAGAHLDSVPAGPGLNDNGSGVAALLEIAEALSDRDLRRTRAVRFAFWGAEEIGLVGSRRYVRALPPRERRRIAAYLNLDMVGSPDADPAVYDGHGVGGRARATSIRIERLLRRRLGRRAGQERLGGASDHAPFAAAGIPVGGLFTGLDDCYHERCDTLRNVDRAVLARSTRATAGAIAALAG